WRRTSARPTCASRATRWRRSTRRSRRRTWPVRATARNRWRRLIVRQARMAGPDGPAIRLKRMESRYTRATRVLHPPTQQIPVAERPREQQHDYHRRAVAEPRTARGCTGLPVTRCYHHCTEHEQYTEHRERERDLEAR